KEFKSWCGLPREADLWRNAAVRIVSITAYRIWLILKPVEPHTWSDGKRRITYFDTVFSEEAKAIVVDVRCICLIDMQECAGRALNTTNTCVITCKRLSAFADAEITANSQRVRKCSRVEAEIGITACTVTLIFKFVVAAKRTCERTFTDGVGAIRSRHLLPVNGCPCIVYNAIILALITIIERYTVTIIFAVLIVIAIVVGRPCIRIQIGVGIITIAFSCDADGVATFKLLPQLEHKIAAIIIFRVGLCAGCAISADVSGALNFMTTLIRTLEQN